VHAKPERYQNFVLEGARVKDFPDITEILFELLLFLVVDVLQSLILDVK